MAGFYMTNLQSLCQRRGWPDPTYECFRDGTGHQCMVLVNDHDYQTDITYESDYMAKENAAMVAWWNAGEQHSQSSKSPRRHTMSSISSSSKNHGNRSTKMSISAFSDDSGYGSVLSDSNLEDVPITQRFGKTVEKKDLNGIISPFLESLTRSFSEKH
ncbi:hypothetical protein PFICI_03573 [Pestalotiopsis fici W106-1]|uniref:DRBM domain-containing protein n=1 Tax=Pestalotiopsis fici (strain W106-1 / CGMCC3.15140) TaxID=1229662 RepID=W3XHJ2_PESFW|nr:uncharacterized protein PFICI_03573 [Pestalotiopsis fici W106-1]ETS85548.1 hypothetical protein PFICI_03573 [Pestalotiopsis fici W106-1]